MSLEAGKEFAHFKIIRKLGEGGMGTVFMAEDTRLNRKVAIKVLHSENFNDPERLERFKREAQTAAKISSPHVMAIFNIDSDTDEDDNQFDYIVMEYVQGVSLSEYLAEKQRPFNHLLRIAEKTASGLASAHKLGIVHRDIKPDNIIINDDNDPKILDFGLAKPQSGIFRKPESDKTETVSSDLTQEGKILGTVSYMSPEQARGEKVDIRSDIFSFGILLYKLFSGRFPFEGSDRVSTMAKILEARQTSIREYNQSIPAELERIIDKCLQKDPQDRYQDSRDLVVDLRSLRKRFDSGDSDTQSFIGSAPQSKKSSSMISWKAIVAIVAVIGIFAIIYSMRGKPSQSTTADGQPENALAILNFENKTNDPELDWLKAGLPEIMETDLTREQSGNIISRRRIFNHIANKLDENATEITYSSGIQAARSLGASSALSGSFYKVGDQIRIDARVEDVGSGNVLLAERVVGDDPFQLVDSLTSKIAVSLDIQITAAEEDVTTLTSSSQEAYKQYILGIRKFETGRHDEALEYFTEAVSLDTTFALAYMRAGMSSAFLGRPQRSSEFFTKALKYKDKLNVQDRSLLEIYADLWLRSRFESAYIKIQSYISNYPNDFEGRYFYAIFLYNMGSRQMALAQIDTLLFYQPKDRWTLDLAAEIYTNMGEFDKAIDFAKKLIEHHPNSPAGYSYLAYSYRRIGEIDKAIEQYEKLLEIDPGNVSAYTNLHRMEVLKRDFETAGEYLERMRGQYEDEPYIMSDYYSLKADLTKWRGDFNASLDLLKNAITASEQARDSSYVSTHSMMLAGTYLLLNELDSAYKYSKQSAEWATPQFQAFSHMFMLYELGPRYHEEAEKHFDVLLRDFKRRLPEQLWPLAESLEELFKAKVAEDTAAMIKAYEKLRKIPQQDVTTSKMEHGTLLVLTGNYAEGLELLQKVIEGNNQTTRAQSYLLSLYYAARAEEGMENYQRAIKYYEELISYTGDNIDNLRYINDADDRLEKLRQKIS
ncbi:MAG: protein kinase [candidate division Zixibacteria bacterium]|nr:protein kinase [candidate division Zixibacteria bacterium]